MKSRFGAWVTLSMLTAATSSCGLILGLEQDYQEKGGAGGSGSAATSSAESGGSQASGSSASGGGVSGLPHCAGLPPKCGPNGDEDCCKSLLVMGGSNFLRDGRMEYPASVSDFYLDRFEVTVGRFRQFLAAYPQSKPVSGAGAYPHVNNSGWDSSWDPYLPASREEIIANLKTGCMDKGQFLSFTDAPGDNENKPINCLSWHEAFAFCAWDGGRLPTDLEWNYAAMGGGELRDYPWGSDAPDIGHAAFDCIGDGSIAGDCKATDILNVGTRSPKGDGKWLHADLAGNVGEWALDNWASEYPVPCDNCAKVDDLTGPRVARGGGWGDNDTNVQASSWAREAQQTRGEGLGVRCARDTN